jgi:hypothetical protein
MKSILSSFILILLIFSNLYSQGIPYGQEFQVDTDTTDQPWDPSVAALNDGSFVVCWVSMGQDSFESDIYGQIFSPLGVKKGNEFRVNTYTNSDQFFPSVTGLSDGGFIICWESWGQDGSGFGIYSQLFDVSGARRGDEFQVNTSINDSQGSPSVLGLAEGGFVVVWQSNDGHNDGIFGQIFDVTGNKKGNEFQINTYTKDSQYEPSIAELPDGRFVVCWTSFGQDGSVGGSIYGQIFNSSGNKIGNEFQVNTYTYMNQDHPSVVALSDNSGFVVCWQGWGYDGLQLDIFGQMFDVVGEKKGSEFQINTASYLSQNCLAMAALVNGGFVIGWNNGFDNFSDIFAQVFKSGGVRRWNEFQVNTQTYWSQGLGCIAALKDNGFVACWSCSGNGYGFKIMGKRFPDEPLNHQLREFSLLEPLNDATEDTTYITFVWQQPSNTIECYTWEITFDLHIDTDINFPNPQIIKNIQDTTFTIDSLAAGKTYFWKVLAKNLAGDSLWSTQQDWGFFIKPGATFVENADIELPQNFELFQNYPNPFNSSTEIKYSLPNTKACYKVQLKVYDVLGRLVKVLLNQEQLAGSYAINWDGTDLGGNRVASGVYFYSLDSGEFKSVRKMLVLQ